MTNVSRDPRPRRHLRLVAPHKPSVSVPAQTVLEFGCLTAEERGADVEQLRPVGEIIAVELARIRDGLRSRGGVG